MQIKFKEYYNRGFIINTVRSEIFKFRSAGLLERPVNQFNFLLRNYKTPPQYEIKRNASENREISRESVKKKTLRK